MAEDEIQFNITALVYETEDGKEFDIPGLKAAATKYETEKGVKLCFSSNQLVELTLFF